MQLQYDIAFSICFKHEFFSDGNLKSLAVTPSDETERILRSTGGIVKTFKNGIYVLYESFFAGKERSRLQFLEDEPELKFLLKNTDDAFFTYTSGFDTDISSCCFYFKNGKNQSAQQKGRLHTGAFAEKDTLKPVSQCDAAYFIKPFGIIHIQLHKNLEESFTISFSGASTYWCYVLTKDYLQELVNPAVICKNTKEAFIGPEQIQLPDNRTALAFFSKMPIAHKERQAASYQLVEEYDINTHKYKVVLQVLPHPGRDHISSLKKIAEQKGKIFSYIFI